MHEAQQHGFVFNPDDLDGDIYDAETIRKILSADGSLPAGGTIAGHD